MEGCKLFDPNLMHCLSAVLHDLGSPQMQETQIAVSENCVDGECSEYFSSNLEENLDHGHVYFQTHLLCHRIKALRNGGAVE